MKTERKFSFREKLNAKKTLIGTHLQMPVPEHAELLAMAGFDYIWMDAEHGPFDDRTLLLCISLAQAMGTAAVVRVPMNDYNATKRILEMGPDGIIFPVVNTREQAETLILSTFYPPLGNRGFGPMRAVEYGERDVREYVERGVFEMARFVQIESEEAVRNLKELLKVPYIDGFIVGPNDLSASVGELCRESQPKTTALIREIGEILREKDRLLGVSTGDSSAENLTFWKNIGCRMISAGMDHGFLLNGAKQMRACLGTAFGSADL